MLRTHAYRAIVGNDVCAASRYSARVTLMMLNRCKVGIRGSVLALVTAIGMIAADAKAQQSTRVRFATWNMAWLTERLPGSGGEGGVPANIYHRTPADFDLVAKYVKRLNADVVAFQEVDGASAAAKVFSSNEYQIHVTDEPDVQRPGFAVRKRIDMKRNPDFVALDILASEPRSLRRGADITLQIGDQQVRMLAVHLKSGCPQQALGGANANCRLLKRQLPILAKWIDDRVQEGIPFVVLGDFNRTFSDTEEFWKGMNAGGSNGLRRSTANQLSDCWAGKHPQFIDHLVLGGPARFWFDSNSFKVLVYDEVQPSFEQKISDHCPQYADFNIGGNGVLTRLWQ